MDTDAPQLIKEEQTAQMLVVTKACLRKWRLENTGPEFFRVGRCIRYSVAGIQRFLAENSSRNAQPVKERKANGGGTGWRFSFLPWR